jgi:hypothetical protein
LAFKGTQERRVTPELAFKATQVLGRRVTPELKAILGSALKAILEPQVTQASAFKVTRVLEPRVILEPGFKAIQARRETQVSAAKAIPVHRGIRALVFKGTQAHKATLA